MPQPAVLFALDVTLLDSSEGINKCARFALSHYGIEEPDTNKMYQFIGPPLSDSFQKLYGFSPEKAKEAVDIYRKRYNKTGIFECSLYPGVEGCIRSLRQLGYRIGMASSKPELSCRRILEHFGLLSLFDEVVGATFDGTRDKKEDVLREVFRRWKDLSPRQMCLGGDTVFDAEGARKVGMPCVAVTYGFGDLAQMEEAGIVASCENLSLLPELIKNLDISEDGQE